MYKNVFVRCLSRQGTASPMVGNLQLIAIDEVFFVLVGPVRVQSHVQYVLFIDVVRYTLAPRSPGSACAATEYQISDYFAHGDIRIDF